MLIGELSRRTGVHAHLLRYYESQGLVTPTRTAGGYREYTEEAVVTVAQIRSLLDAGLTTEEIAFTLPCATGPTPELESCPELLAVLRSRLRVVEERIDTLLRTRQALRGYIDATARQSDAHCSAPDPATPRSE